MAKQAKKTAVFLIVDVKDRRNKLAAGLREIGYDGDAVMMTHNGTKNREHIESVELYRVFPAEHNGLTVESAWTWIDS